jgi:hypothetical protein
LSALSAAKAILEADGTLLATATGGIWDFDETGRLGINRTTAPAAFDANEIIKPCVLLKLRSSEPDQALVDEGTRYQSVNEALEVWFYEDTGYSNIETMRDRVWILLHAVQLSGTFMCLWTGDVRQARDTDLDASVERSVYRVTTSKSA